MNSTVPAKSETLKVPGASLHYEVRGSGPVLLMIPGGPANAGDFNRIAGELASDFTVVTYDPRGLAHSTLEAPFNDDRAVQIAADDVQRLLKAVTDEPANVFGSSGGADADAGGANAANHACLITGPFMNTCSYNE